jgi:hypothetical protein
MTLDALLDAALLGTELTITPQDGGAWLKLTGIGDPVRVPVPTEDYETRALGLEELFEWVEQMGGATVLAPVNAPPEPEQEDSDEDTEDPPSGGGGGGIPPDEDDNPPGGDPPGPGGDGEPGDGKGEPGKDDEDEDEDGNEDEEPGGEGGGEGEPGEDDDEDADGEGEGSGADPEDDENEPSENEDGEADDGEDGEDGENGNDGEDGEDGEGEEGEDGEGESDGGGEDGESEGEDGQEGGEGEDSEDEKGEKGEPIEPKDPKAGEGEGEAEGQWEADDDAGASQREQELLKELEDLVGPPPVAGSSGGAGRNGTPMSGMRNYTDQYDDLITKYPAPHPKLQRDITMALEALFDGFSVGAGYLESPRIDGAKLIRELVSKRYRLSSARRAELDPPVSLVLIDISGSCADLIRTSLPMVRSFTSNPLVGVVLHFNGTPTEAFGAAKRAKPMDSYTGHLDLTAWWMDQIRTLNVAGVVAWGDSDAKVQYEAIGRKVPVVWLDNAGVWGRRAESGYETVMDANSPLWVTSRAGLRRIRTVSSIVGPTGAIKALRLRALRNIRV